MIGININPFSSTLSELRQRLQWSVTQAVGWQSLDSNGSFIGQYMYTVGSPTPEIILPVNMM